MEMGKAANRTETCAGWIKHQCLREQKPAEKKETQEKQWEGRPGQRKFLEGAIAERPRKIPRELR
jgi:hypothetical protein